MKKTAFALMLACVSVHPAAATPRDVLAHAAFATADKAAALAQIQAVNKETGAVLARQPANREAQLVHAMAIGYEAKLTRSRSMAVAAKADFEGLATRDPRDPEALAAIGSWHLDAVASLGSFLAGTALGASKAKGMAALDRAVALGGGRALFLGVSALLRLELDPGDKRGLALLQAAAKGSTPTPLDGQMQRSANLVLKKMQGGSSADIKALCRQLLPLGRFS